MVGTRKFPVVGSGGEGQAPRPWSHTDERLAALAHELRGPLAAILYAAETIPDARDGDPTAGRTRAVLRRQARQAVRIVDDLFDVCAGVRGRLSVHPEVVDLSGVVRVATETVGHLVASMGHRLTVSLPPEPLLVLADPVRLEQVLTNLLGNAVKFTDRGGHVRVTAAAEAGQAVLRVRDNGRGIAPCLLPRVFDLYSQGTDGGGTPLGGLGIGLALVKTLVELHGGSVAAFSDGVGCGAEFVVRLPANVRGV